MPTRPSSAGKKSGKKDAGKKGKKKSAKNAAIDPHQEQLDALIREREEIRSKLNLICSKILENINMEDYQGDIDLSKQQPSDISMDHLLSMIDQICYYRVAFLSLFQETDENERLTVHRKITQLAVDQPEMFRKRLTSEQRLTFVTRERDVWKENAQLLQIMYATIVDQLEMGMFKKNEKKSEEILQNHRLNVEDVSLIFSSSRVRSINDAQKIRAKKTLETELDGFRSQHAFFDLDQTDSEQTLPVNGHLPAIESSSSVRPTSENGARRRIHSDRRSVSFADRVNVLNDDDEQELQPIDHLDGTNDFQEHFASSSSSLLINPSVEYSSHPEQYPERLLENNYYDYSSPPSQNQSPYSTRSISMTKKSSLPSKYRLPSARDTLVNKMDSNLRMLIIKELSKNGHTERPLSRMSSAYGGSQHSGESSSRHRDRVRSSAQEDVPPEWVELARLIGIDESEIEHWLSQNLQYPAGRVISAWCNYASPPPTVAELHSVLSSKQLNRTDLARYIETMYIIE